MSKKFARALKNSATVQRTENNAVGYSTSFNPLVDFNFKLPSFRTAAENIVIAAFELCMAFSPRLALKFMFYVRDIRGGAGERKTFRTILRWFSENYPEKIAKIFLLIPEYGRWDDLFSCKGTKGWETIKKLIVIQIVKDSNGERDNLTPSLLAKWMPSINTSSKNTRILAAEFVKEIGITEKEYRKMLSNLRKRIKIVEKSMSANKWTEINYEHVPSKANLLYRNAFLKRDPERRKAFLELVSEGKVSIKGSTNFPYEVIHQIHLGKVDETVEALWKALPDYGISNTLVVADTSGSMGCSIGGGSTTAYEACISLALYCAERNLGPFKDQVILFSDYPKWIHAPAEVSLKSRYEIVGQQHNAMNTDIEAVFNMILKVAKETSCSQEEMPRNILILSDMEFDAADDDVDAILFSEIEKRFQAEGYKLPKLTFWNLNSRTNTIPIRENEMGVGIVSGFSPAILKMVMSEKLDPWTILEETLESERYSRIEDIL